MTFGRLRRRSVCAIYRKSWGFSRGHIGSDAGRTYSFHVQVDCSASLRMAPRAMLYSVALPTPACCGQSTQHAGAGSAKWQSVACEAVRASHSRVVSSWRVLRFPYLLMHLAELPRTVPCERRRRSSAGPRSCRPSAVARRTPLPPPRIRRADAGAPSIVHLRRAAMPQTEMG